MLSHTAQSLFRSERLILPPDGSVAKMTLGPQLSVLLVTLSAKENDNIQCQASFLWHPPFCKYSLQEYKAQPPYLNRHPALHQITILLSPLFSRMLTLGILPSKNPAWLLHLRICFLRRNARNKCLEGRVG